MNIGLPAMCSVSRSASARCTIAYVPSFDHVWSATREEIAEWYVKDHPSHIA
jgi:hypothetical protein